MDTAKHRKITNRRHDSNDILFRYANLLGFGHFHVKFDQETGLKAIIAVHNTKLGPALGGCRMVHYTTTAKAMEDALRLAYMMAMKAAISNLPHGGAKAVLIKPAVIHDREAYFAKFAEFVNELNGSYITAVDSGTEPADMDVVARYSRFVSCTTADGDPAPYTALGVRRGIEAAAKYKLGRDSIEGLSVAIQGVGHVGYQLAKQLHQLGVKLTACDVNQDLLQLCAKEFDAKVVLPEEIYDAPVDVFAPCALGSILTLNTIKRLKAKIVAGSANNQLANMQFGKAMFERGILYAPDFVINAGGLIQASTLYNRGDKEKAKENINNIYYTLLEIFERS
ncbi:MAG TPA: Glu/Leu/Phe/Val dehydrogenase dimerization domain-containing protein, partial [Gammaproteobacteria bacterium]|nr:Glu/Leu/Phe/Val dehydrogenase dimerization domain-containing protein [Gammaproteobacteria bacterium]